MSTINTESTGTVPAPGPAPATTPKGGLALAAAASLGAGAIHAAAIGAHAEHQQVVKVFTVLAVAQLGWGALALVRPSRGLAGVGAAINLAAIVGWILAKTSGISFVDGLETSEPVQWSDGLAAGLALVAVIGAVAVVARIGLTVAAATGPASPGGLRRAGYLGTAAIAVLSITAMNAAAGHSHAGAGHGSESAAADHDHVVDEEGTETAAHDSTHADSAHADSAGTGAAGDDASAEEHADHGVPAAVAPVPYDPAMPIDLGGVEGVTPQQQARAENLIAITLARLPQFADVSTLEAKGYNSIQDASTGHEHYINWDLINDGRQLDPDYPESLVFEMLNGQKTLVSAMFMAEGDVTLDNVPDVGGALTQWHIHDNLCYTSDDPPRVRGLTRADGSCSPGLRTLGQPVPMIHVWIRAHKCGPFAALEGVGAGKVKEGETTLCDAAHGGHAAS